jgi:hypothetical protein
LANRRSDREKVGARAPVRAEWFGGVFAQFCHKYVVKPWLSAKRQNCRSVFQGQLSYFFGDVLFAFLCLSGAIAGLVVLAKRRAFL